MRAYAFCQHGCLLGLNDSFSFFYNKDHQLSLHAHFVITLKPVNVFPVQVGSSQLGGVESITSRVTYNSH